MACESIRPKRRRLWRMQFRLRSLMLLCLFVAVALGWWVDHRSIWVRYEEADRLYKHAKQENTQRLHALEQLEEILQHEGMTLEVDISHKAWTSVKITEESGDSVGYTHWETDPFAREAR